uniref:Uncharacterized protein n=1 Tax=Glossina palpalis gambiensis TaxID=67801 RepID=A0A1B0C4S9_9MUSC
DVKGLRVVVSKGRAVTEGGARVVVGTCIVVIKAVVGMLPNVLLISVEGRVAALKGVVVTFVIDKRVLAVVCGFGVGVRSGPHKWIDDTDQVLYSPNAMSYPKNNYFIDDRQCQKILAFTATDSFDIRMYIHVLKKNLETSKLLTQFEYGHHQLVNIGRPTLKIHSKF